MSDADIVYLKFCPSSLKCFVVTIIVNMSTRTLQFGKTIASTSFLMTHSVAEINYLYSLCYEFIIVGTCNIHGKQRAKRTRSMLKTDIQNDTEIYYYTIAMNYLQK